MSMLDGVSQCWLLSETCVVNWDAWAAIGTVAAVFAAIFAPAIQRLLIRRRANAMFALAYRIDLLMALTLVRSIRREFPFGMNNAEAWAAEALVLTDEKFREDFDSKVNGLDSVTSRDVDLTKWVGVDVGLAAKVALAIETTRHLQQAARGLVAAARSGDAADMFAVVEHVGGHANDHLYKADCAAVRALKPITRQKTLDG